MHVDLVQRYIELQALVVAPIIPHWADYIWSEVLNKVTVPLILLTLFPKLNFLALFDSD